ncbi:MAG: hypothetical protein QXR19_16880 [Candidatus Jordarchaeaceae archaeon]
MMDRFKEFLIQTSTIRETLKKLAEESVETPLNEKYLLEQLMILRAEIDTLIDALKTYDDFSIPMNLFCRLKERGVNTIMVKPFKDRWTVYLDLTQGKVLLLDTLLALAGPENFFKAIRETKLEDVKTLLKDVLYIELNDGRRFQSWGEVTHLME